MNSTIEIGSKKYILDELKQTEYDNAIYLGNDENSHLILVKATSSKIHCCDIHRETRVILDYAFSGCENISELCVPENVEQVFDSSFEGCIGIKTLYFNAIALKTVESYAFSHMGTNESGVRVVVGSQVQSLPNNCANLRDFYVSPENKRFMFHDEVIYDKQEGIAIYAMRGISGDVVLWEGTKHIARSAFLECRNLTSVVVPRGVKTIAPCAFFNCESLRSVCIPDSVESLGEKAFCNCKNLLEITIPSSVESIARECFNSCVSLMSVTIMDGVKSIGHRAFTNCKKLTQLNIGNTVETIGSYSFECCAKLYSLVIPDCVYKIGESAFKDCMSLVSVTLGCEVSEIGCNAFGGNPCRAEMRIFQCHTFPPIDTAFLHFSPNSDSFFALFKNLHTKNLFSLYSRQIQHVYYIRIETRSFYLTWRNKHADHRHQSQKIV